MAVTRPSAGSSLGSFSALCHLSGDRNRPFICILIFGFYYGASSLKSGEDDIFLYALPCNCTVSPGRFLELYLGVLSTRFRLFFLLPLLSGQLETVVAGASL